MAQSLDGFQTALRFTLQWEGGATPSGTVNRGIMQVTYDTYRKRKSLPLQPVLKITETEVEDIYYNDYWKASKADTMCLPLAIVHFDSAVNFGITGSLKLLQEALGVLPVDGKFGQKTVAALEKKNTLETAKLYCQARIDARHERVQKNPSDSRYLKGWLRRDNDLLQVISQLDGEAASKADAGKTEEAKKDSSPAPVTPSSPPSSGVSAENKEKIADKLEQAISLLHEIAELLKQSK
ncbi:glycoside hydrolase family 108 protein [Kamptonema formosum]|uniref:glycoside hydrolase family 108 protein n=1 Tax=Kamptonema formosum TaxID=331992 RepID=UPI0003462A9C|nr:glycosyl hydrolase 108 family protein [Oscillatoria sp. PCC 10802]